MSRLLDLVPRFMRSWPILRRWYWQREELAAAHEWATETAAFFADLDEEQP